MSMPVWTTFLPSSLAMRVPWQEAQLVMAAVFKSAEHYLLQHTSQGVAGGVPAK